MIRRSPLNTPAVWPEWYLLCSSTSNSQPVWPGQYKPVSQLQSSSALCSACAASSLKGSRCIYRAPCMHKALWSPAHTLTSFTHTCTANRAQLSPTAMAEHHRHRTLNNPSSVLRATETPQDNSWGLFQLQGWSEEAGEQHASSSYCVPTKMKESAWNLLMEYLSLLSSGSWACFGKTDLKLCC